MRRLPVVLSALLLAAVAPAQQADLEAAKGQGILVYLAVCFAGGLLSLLTPCVFPMVPVTVSYFSKREKGRALPESLSYGIGIISTFVVLGIGASLIFGATGIADFAANGWVNLFLGLLFVVLALNLFGVFEIKVPAALARKTDKQRTRGGLIGPFFMGMTFSLTSFTCTAPIAGSLLAASASGDGLLYPVLGMLSYGIAFAAPFFFLAMSPSALSKLPRSGEWMNTVKPALAFLELAAAVKFLSNADLAFELGLITRPVFLVLWTVIFVCMAGYLFGVPKALKQAGLGRRITGTGTLAFAGLLLLGMGGWPLGIMEGFPPPDPYPTKSVTKRSAPVQGNRVITEIGKRIDTEDYAEALQLAKDTGKPIFIDFTGVNCVNCRLMEKHIFPKDKVSAELDKMVNVKLFTDRANPQDKANQALQKELAQNIALPTYVILTPEGKVIDKFEGLALSEDEFVQFLKKAGT